MPAIRHQSIGSSPEFERIANLPRRTWSDAEGEKLARILTAKLKHPQGTMSLRPAQAIALYEFQQQKGLVAHHRVGAGKTLTTLLAPTVVGETNYALVVPAALREKTIRERAELGKHWKLPLTFRIWSYQELGRVQGANILTQHKPRLLVFDEAHLVKNLKAGVTRRIKRYFEDYPSTMCLACSGTLIRNSIKDFAHLSNWALKERSPLPIDWAEVLEWAEALDDPDSFLSVMHPGKLLSLPGGDPDADERTKARQKVQARMLETPGVVGSRGAQVGSSLYLSPVTYAQNAHTTANFERLRGQWETPDGYAISEAVVLWKTARELALGFHYVTVSTKAYEAWSKTGGRSVYNRTMTEAGRREFESFLADARPPEEWLTPRKDWAKFVRGILEESRTLDTEAQVALACAAGKLRRREYDDWRAVRDTFDGMNLAVWHDDGALKACEEWAKKAENGIIWVEHRFFAQELAARTGLPYFGLRGANVRGELIDAPATMAKYPVVIASISSNSTGRNLQRYNQNLVVSVPTNGQTWEQLIGRQHREGQTADTVTLDVFLGCAEHHKAIPRALEQARAIKDTVGEEQKLLLCDINWPTLSPRGPAFGSNKSKKADGIIWDADLDGEEDED